MCGPNCTLNIDHLSDEPVMITAVPHPMFEFSGWSNSLRCLEESGYNCTLLPGHNSEENIQVNFQLTEPSSNLIFTFDQPTDTENFALTFPFGGAEAELAIESRHLAITPQWSASDDVIQLNRGDLDLSLDNGSIYIDISLSGDYLTQGNSTRDNITEDMNIAFSLEDISGNTARVGNSRRVQSTNFLSDNWTTITETNISWDNLNNIVGDFDLQHISSISVLVDANEKPLEVSGKILLDNFVIVEGNRYLRQTFDFSQPSEVDSWILENNSGATFDYLSYDEIEEALVFTPENWDSEYNLFFNFSEENETIVGGKVQGTLEVPQSYIDENMSVLVFLQFDAGLTDEEDDYSFYSLVRYTPPSNILNFELDVPTEDIVDEPIGPIRRIGIQFLNTGSTNSEPILIHNIEAVESVVAPAPLPLLEQGFETSPAGTDFTLPNWTVYLLDTVATYRIVDSASGFVRSGNQSLEVEILSTTDTPETGNPWEIEVSRNNLNVLPGEFYEYSIWVYAEGGDASINFNAQGDESTNYSDKRSPETVIIHENLWTNVKFLTVPNNETDPAIRTPIHMNFPENEGLTLYFDDLQIIQR